MTAHLESTSLLTPSSLMPEVSNWYVIYTKPRHEKRIFQQLHEKRIFAFLPLLQQIHRWSDRWSKLEVPLFGCYVFIRIDPTSSQRPQVLRTPGVLGFVGSMGQGTAIPDEQIENLHKTIRERIPCALHPFITAGKRVRIRGGSLDGVEGILVSQNQDQRLVVSVELLRRSVSIQVKGYDIELV